MQDSLDKPEILPTKKTAIILAASRESDENVFLREVLFCPMVALAAQTCADAGISDVYVIIKSEGDRAAYEAAFARVPETAVCVLSAEGASTTHIVTAIKTVLDCCGSNIILLRGDIPFIDEKVITKSFDHHIEQGTAATVLTTQGGDENRSAVWFSAAPLIKALLGEQKLPERSPLHLLPDLLWQQSEKVDAYFAENPEFSLRASSSKDVFALNSMLRSRVIDAHIEKGVEFLSTDGVLIGQNVKIGQGTQILPGTILRGNTQIGKNCVIGPNSLLDNCKLGSNTRFNASQGYNCVIGSGVAIGPFCHIRPDSVIKDRVHIGDFVEIKNSTLDEGTHVSHLTYVGDSDVGKRVNFGCGVVTVNYNGRQKARCIIGDDAFIGCNTNLVAPVQVGENGYTAAGSTITEDVPAESLAIARARQVNKDEYNKKLRG